MPPLCTFYDFNWIHVVAFSLDGSSFIVICGVVVPSHPVLIRILWFSDLALVDKLILIALFGVFVPSP